MSALTLRPRLPEVLTLLRAHPALVLTAPPGSGKTTLVAPALLDAGLARRVLLLQPRRVAARLCAHWIATSRGSAVGEEAGYSVRFERRVGPLTRLEVLTEGLLTRRLQQDPYLEGVDAVVFDEFHERSLHADLALALCRELARARPELKLVVMSATMDTGPLASWLGAPVFHAPGRAFPVEIEHAPRVDARPLEVRCARAIEAALDGSRGGQILGPHGGHVLAFLPGVREIEAVARELRWEGPVHRLHGGLAPAEQDAALAPSSRQKVVLSTNLAETSVTLDGVGAVVDSGLVRVPRFALSMGIERLHTEPISRASADQRAGRAGRTGPGRCVRLWTLADHVRRPAHGSPDIERLDLARTLLEVYAWGARPEQFEWFEAPPPAALQRARDLLVQLGAIDGEQLTPRGRALAELPLHPRLGTVVVEGHALGCLREAAAAAALASEASPALSSALEGSGDLLDAIALVDDPRGVTGPARGALERVRKTRSQLLGLAPSGGPPGVAPDGVTRALVAGFPDRVGQRRRSDGPQFLLADGGGATLAPAVRFDGADYLVAVVMDGASERSGDGGRRIRLGAALEADALATQVSDVLAFEGEAVVQRRRRTFGALVLSDDPAPERADPEEVARLLEQHARLAPERAFKLDAAALALLDRLDFLRDARPDLGLPRLTPSSGEAPEAALVSLLPGLCAGRRSFAELRRADLCEAVLAQLDWQQRGALDRLAPERLALPSGVHARLRYQGAGAPPLLAARVQQLFGLNQTPSLCGVPLLLHLLAPNGQIVQITQDLAGFWERTWPEVRRDLRGRYPRHAWPERPPGAPGSLPTV